MIEDSSNPGREPNCIDPGFVNLVCSMCGGENTTKEVPKNPDAHDYSGLTGSSWGDRRFHKCVYCGTEDSSHEAVKDPDDEMKCKVCGRALPAE